MSQKSGKKGDCSLAVVGSKLYAQDICVVVSTHKSYEHKGGSIEAVLTALCCMTPAPAVIAIAENSGPCSDRDRLKEFLTRNKAATEFAYVEMSSAVGDARNAAARLVPQPIIVFVDDDTIPLQIDALARVMLRARSAAHGYGAQRLWSPPPPWSTVSMLNVMRQISAGDFDAMRLCARPPDPALRKKTQANEKYLWRSFIANFGFVHRRIFDDVGGFPNGFHGYGKEDDLLMLKLFLEVGAPAILDDLEVLHISHHSAELESGLDQENDARYKAALAEMGIDKFHIGDLLFADLKRDRSVVKMRLRR